MMSRMISKAAIAAALALPLACAAGSAGIAEPKGSKVSVLNRDLFPRFIARNPLVLMEWYAPWCGHCQELAPKFREAADQLAALKKKGEIPVAVKFAKMNDGDEYNHAGRFGAPEVYNFSSYPALYVFRDGQMLDPYFGGREVDDLVFWMANLAKGLDPIDEEINSRPGLYRTKTAALPDLSPETFNATVLRPAADGNNAMWVVEFYSDRCPFCKSLSPEVVAAAERLATDEPRVRIAAVNSRIYYGLAEENGIKGYPWVAAFYNGEKVEDMAGLGGADSIVDFGTRKANELFEASLGEGPAAAPFTYDPDGVLAMAPAVAAWAAADAATHNAVDWRQAIEDARSEDAKAKKAQNEGDKPKAAAPAKAPPPEPTKAAPTKAAAPRAAAPAVPAPASVAVAASGDASGSGDEAPPSSGAAWSDADKGLAWRQTLGRRTWFFLHTLAAKYPDYPSDVDQRTMRNLVASLGQHYPCKLCRQHLKLKLADPILGAVRVENRTALSVWFCELHNMVNVDTGKAHVQDCSPFALDLLYLKDCGECEVPTAAKAHAAGDGDDDDSGDDSGGHTSAVGNRGGGGAGVFDARLYAKDDLQLRAELAEAVDALAARAAALEAENGALKAALAQAHRNLRHLQ